MLCKILMAVAESITKLFQQPSDVFFLKKIKGLESSDHHLLAEYMVRKYLQRYIRPSQSLRHYHTQ